MGTDDAAGGRLAPETDHPPSLAERSLRRHTPEVGAVCGKAARTVLCGGRSVMGVPTASFGFYARLLLHLLASGYARTGARRDAPMLVANGENRTNRL